MSNTLILYEKNNAAVTAGFVDGRMSVLEIEEKENPYKVGNIYTGRVSKIVLHLKAAYIDIGMPKLCYMELKPNTLFVSDKSHPDGNLHVGDIILVQIVKDAKNSKPVTVSSEISIAGRYFVTKLSSNSAITFSGKLKNGDFKRNMKKELSGLLVNKLNLLVRTNAYELSAHALKEEALNSIMVLQNLLDGFATKQKGSLVYVKEPDYIVNLRDNSSLKYDNVITDSPDIYMNIKEWKEEQSRYLVQPCDQSAVRTEQLSDSEQDEITKNENTADCFKLSFYSDKVLPLENLYDMRKNLSELCRERVWLNSGAHIVIEKTEALTSIDVNTSKSSGLSKNFMEGFKKINIEAAHEIVRQLMLRNISGIIIIDFINMESTDAAGFMSDFTNICKADPTIQVVDMTALGLVEITRKRNKQPVYDLIKKYRLDE